MNKKYIPIIIFLVLCLFSWLEETLISEGHFHDYLYLPEHKFLHLFIRGIYILFIFGLGYIGMNQLSVQWVKTLWLYWYALAFFVAGLRIILDIILGHYFNDNIVSILSIFYSLNLTPLPYIVLWVLAMIANENKQACNS